MNDAGCRFPADLIAALPVRLVPWFLAEKRDLEWRKNPTPYRVWVSEIMLQQTRVEAVKPFYDRFLSVLPDIASLAAADEETLLKLWEGLGYYRRVRNMQAAAQLIMTEYGGVFPQEYDQVRALPGIGDYTAGAILSIAFGKPEPAVDGNVLRVITRITGSEANIDDTKVRKSMTALLREVYPADHCSEFTQSLMELGATVCLPNGDPRCLFCPMKQLCRAFADGTIDRIPVRKPKAGRRIENLAVLILRHGGKIAVGKRPESGLLAGLWEFPNVSGSPASAELKKRFSVHTLKEAGTAVHIFSHVEWHMTLYEGETDEFLPDFRWLSPEELQRDTALPGAFKAARAIALRQNTARGGRKRR